MVYEQTRLGQLLLGRGLVQPGQIARALSLQGATRRLLGEILVEQGWLSERCLGRILRLQRRLRAALGVAALAGVPIVAIADDALQARAEPITTRASASTLLALDEAELGNVSAGNPGVFAPESGAPGLRVDVAGSGVLGADVSRQSWKLMHDLAGAGRVDLREIPAPDHSSRTDEDEDARTPGLSLAHALASMDRLDLGGIPLASLLGLNGVGNVQMRVSYR
jgi:hypothetical protein